MIKRLFAFLKKPSIIFIFIIWLLTVLFIVCDIVLMVGQYETWLSYAVFALSALLLAYSVYTIIIFAPDVRKKMTERLKKLPFFNSMLENYGFRTIVFSVASFTINLAFILFNGVLGIITSSIWYGVIACYYIFLSGLRGAILYLNYRSKKYDDKSPEISRQYKLKIYGLCGVLLLVLEVALAAAVTLLVIYKKPTEYSQIMAIAAAAYTFYKVIFAIINVFKVKTLKDPILQCFRNINLADAAMSLLSLQVTLIAVFSEGENFSANGINAMNAATGFVVCALTVVLGSIMIAGSRRDLKKIREKKTNERNG